jgi:hypothetical protein
MGGLDLFKSTLTNGNPGAPVNLNAPLNSTYDDFGLLMNDSANGGYLSTNRKQSTEDNIYSFHRNIIQFTLDGIAVERNTQVPLAGVNVVMTNVKTGKKETVVTGDDGKFMFKLDQNSEYTIVGTKDAYFSDTAPVSTMGKTVSEDMHVTLKLELEQIIIDKPIVLENIYYDLDKWENPGRCREGLGCAGDHHEGEPRYQYRAFLPYRFTRERCLQHDAFPKTSPVGRGLHHCTRCRQKADYSEGYGESKLVNKCANGVKCTESEHQQNRRTEFKVTSFGQ